METKRYWVWKYRNEDDEWILWPHLYSTEVEAKEDSRHYIASIRVMPVDIVSTVPQD